MQTLEQTDVSSYRTTDAKVLLTVAEAAERTGKSRGAIHDAIKRRELPRRRDVEGKKWIIVRDLDEWLLERPHPSDGDVVSLREAARYTGAERAKMVAAIKSEWLPGHYGDDGKIKTSVAAVKSWLEQGART
jgi:excisionase family DNA binding protein